MQQAINGGSTGLVSPVVADQQINSEQQIQSLVESEVEAENMFKSYN